MVPIGQDSALHNPGFWEESPQSQKTKDIQSQNPAEPPKGQAANLTGRKRDREEKEAKPKFTLPKADHSITIQNKRDRPYITWIAKGVKKAEGRVNTKFYDSLKKTQTVCFHNFEEYVLCKITRLGEYSSFRSMIQREGLKNLLPFARSEEEGVRVYEGFRGSDRVRKCGALAICVEPLEYYIKEEGKVIKVEKKKDDVR
jgi:ASC-1-like (ASCH) protein